MALPALGLLMGVQLGSEILGGVVGLFQQHSARKQAEELGNKFKAQNQVMAQQFLQSQGIQMPPGQGYPHL